MPAAPLAAMTAVGVDERSGATRAAEDVREQRRPSYGIDGALSSEGGSLSSEGHEENWMRRRGIC
jgi:hypothetical protein